MENSQLPTEQATSASNGVFGTKIPSSVAFIVAVLLFFLPFLDIKCNNMSLQKIIGIELATGFNIKPAGSDNSLFGGMEKTTGAKGERKDPYIYALVALALGVGGFLLSLVNKKATAFGGVIIGVLGTAAMIGMIIDIKADIKGEGLGTEDGVKVAVEFTLWFFVTIIAFLAAAFFSYRRMRSEK
jgi:hypothetical protein